MAQPFVECSRLTLVCGKTNVDRRLGDKGFSLMVNLRHAVGNSHLAPTDT